LFYLLVNAKAMRMKDAEKNSGTMLLYTCIPLPPVCTSQPNLYQLLEISHKIISKKHVHCLQYEQEKERLTFAPSVTNITFFLLDEFSLMFLSTHKLTLGVTLFLSC
jgi:hypothetical protein